MDLVFDPCNVQRKPGAHTQQSPEAAGMDVGDVTFGQRPAAVDQIGDLVGIIGVVFRLRGNDRLEFLGVKQTEVADFSLEKFVENWPVITCFHG